MSEPRVPVERGGFLGYVIDDENRTRRALLLMRPVIGLATILLIVLLIVAVVAPAAVAAVAGLMVAAVAVLKVHARRADEWCKTVSRPPVHLADQGVEEF